MPKFIDAAIGKIEAAESLDQPSYALGKAISRTGQIAGKPSKTLANVLHGRPLGHPVHPLAVAIPIGTWTLAFGLDLLAELGLLRDRAAPRAADLALKVGTAGAILSIATGMADWNQLNGRDRRVGLVHGTINTAAVGINIASIVLRGRGRLSAGRWLSGGAFVFTGLSSYLGAHLIYRRKVAVDHADRSPEPRDYKAVVAFADLQDNVPHRVAVWDEVAKKEIGIALVRRGERVHALGARCAHAGGPLDQGWVFEGTLVCPWHGSRFDLETGQTVTGPATCPQPRYHARVVDGIVEVKREQEPGDHVVTADSLAALPPEVLGKAARDVDATPHPKAQDVLYEHHQMIRRLFERILALPSQDPQRHELMRTLAAELDIHEVIEDAIFYPAVQAVSEDTEIAYAEHGVLADMVAATVKHPTSSSEFEEHLRALQAALLHHAGSEERSMFKEAERLSDGRLRELGHQLETMLDNERTSRFRHAFRELKISLLEGI